jgi:hypothetical protein
MKVTSRQGAIYQKVMKHFINSLIDEWKASYLGEDQIK